MSAKNNIASAIARSETHNDIVRVVVADKTSAADAIAEAKRIAADAGLDCGVNKTNEGWDIYACDEDDGGNKMDWRIDLRIAAK
jgi:hypothetical protein